MPTIVHTALSFPFVRFLISGSTAASVHLGLLFVLVEIFGAHYLFASAIAMGAAVITGFVLHKFFAFREHTVERIPHQFVRHLMLFAFSISLNTAFMWVLVERFQLFYLIAQVMVIGTIAIGNFFVYRFFIFHAPHHQSDTHEEDTSQTMVS